MRGQCNASANKVLSEWLSTHYKSKQVGMRILVNFDYNLLCYLREITFMLLTIIFY